MAGDVSWFTFPLPAAQMSSFSRADLSDELRAHKLCLMRELHSEFADVAERLQSLERTVERTSGGGAHVNSEKDVVTAIAPPKTAFDFSPHPPQEAEPKLLPSDLKINDPDEDDDEVGPPKQNSNASSCYYGYSPALCPPTPSKAGQGEMLDHEWSVRHFRSYKTALEAKEWLMEKKQSQRLMERKQKVKFAASSSVFSLKKKVPQAKCPIQDRKIPTTPTSNRVAFSENVSVSTFHPAKCVPSDEWEAAESRKHTWTLLKTSIESQMFQTSIAALVFVNACTIGVQTNIMAESDDKETPLAFIIVELIFCILFTIEIGLKLLTYGLNFLRMPGWRWNLLDVTIVSLQLLDQILEVVDYSLSHFSAFRLLRMLRVVRVLRIIRLIRMISDLRAIVASVIGSMRALAWTVVLLFVIIYIISVYLTQLYVDSDIQGSSKHEFSKYYNSLPRSLLTLYQSISGGLDWNEAVEPLMKDFSPWFGVLFCLYIAFTVLALMNVVTGVFVESALQSAREDKDIYIVNHIRGLIEAMSLDEDGRIAWGQFEAQLSTPEMAEIFNFIDVDPMEARGLFKLLDINGIGSVDPEEFLDGCLRLRGSAKALDLALLMREVKKLKSISMEQNAELMQALDGAKKQRKAPSGASLRKTATTFSLSKEYDFVEDSRGTLCP